MNKNIELMKKELKTIAIIGTENDIVNKYYSEVCKIAEKYGYEANIHDFGEERIYNKGYKDKGNWDSEYIMAVASVGEDLKQKNEQGEKIWKLTVIDEPKDEFVWV